MFDLGKRARALRVVSCGTCKGRISSFQIPRILYDCEGFKGFASNSRHRETVSRPLEHTGQPQQPQQPQQPKVQQVSGELTAKEE